MFSISQTSQERKSFSTQILSEGKFSRLFAGWGSTRIVALKASKDQVLELFADTNGEVGRQDDFDLNLNETEPHNEIKLGPMYSTAIAGCDLMSSGLYTAGICANNSGKVSFCC